MPSPFLSRFLAAVAPGRLDPKWALFSANSFIAAMLAIYLAFRLGLERPYWAMLTVYLTAQPFAGAVRSRAVYRFLGTLLGACAALALVPVLVDQPALLSVAVTAWAALCLYISLQDRTPRSYAFLLAGYTATTIAFSSVAVPTMVFMTALSRVEEILLGIGCATLVHTLLFPSDVTTPVLKSLRAALSDAFARTTDVLSARVGEMQDTGRWKLAADITQIEISATHLRYDTAASKPDLRAIGAVQDQLALVLPMLLSVEDGLAALGERRSAELNLLLSELADWTRAPDRSPASADDLIRRCTSFKVTCRDDRCEWDRLIGAGTVARLATLIEALAAARSLSAALQGGHRTSTWSKAGFRDGHVRRRLHSDPGLAVLSVAALVVAVLGCCAVWIAAAWPEGGVAAQIAAIAAALYSSLDDPAPTLISYALWTLACLPIAAIYLFVIFPAITGFPMLVFSLAPTFLVIGYLQANPRHFIKALALGLGLISALDLQNKFSADFALFINSNAAAMIGLLAAFIAIRLLRSLSASGAAQRLLRHGWADLARLATARRPTSRARWTSIMLDRFGLVIPRLAGATTDIAAEARPLAALQIGLDLLALRQSALCDEERNDPGLQQLLPRLSRAFRWLARGNAKLKPDDAHALLAAIDSALCDTCEDAPARRQRKLALIGLRRRMFPDAHAFSSGEVPR
ncbi:FUSC family protein [Rhodopseudomonas palustris]|uniref:FUSC family protein n=1 Tax=Rhodopseudomonas palustris TaxID=1076 RepID=UPI0020CFA758|nr:FUSC family protein [Rhodopseudomonas palustris]